MKSLSGAEDPKSLIASNKVLQTLIEYNFAKEKPFDLPEGYPEGRSLFMGETNLMQEGRRFYIFTKAGHPTLKKVKREQLFVDMCEGLCEEEARILIAVKDQKLQEMFPILLQLYPERKQNQIP